MKIIISAALLFGLVGAAMADTGAYVALRAGGGVFLLDTDQYMYQAPNAHRSTIAKGDLLDVNAVYHAAIGFGNGPLRVEAEYGYGQYVLSGHWALNTPNGVPGSLPPNLSYPATYELKERMNLFMGNIYYDFLVFNRMFGRPVETPDGGRHRPLRAQSTLYLMGGLGLASLRDNAKVLIDTTMAWGGNALTEKDSITLHRFAFSVGGGVSIGLTRMTHVDIGYKYTDLGRYHEKTTRRDYSLHQVTVGLRYGF